MASSMSRVFWAEVKHYLIISSMDADSPGHQTGIQVLARHYVMPRMLRCMQSQTSNRKIRSSTIRSSYRRRLLTNAKCALFSQYARGWG